MKKLFGTILILCLALSGFSQYAVYPCCFFREKKALKDGSFEIKEFTTDSILSFKGRLASDDPFIRHGRFYFYAGMGRLAATGMYNQDIPYGNWIYFDDNNDTLMLLNYDKVWDYLQNDAQDYFVDPAVIKSLSNKDKEHMNPNGIFNLVEKMPTFNGGDPKVEFRKFVESNLIYPIYAAVKGESSWVHVSFVIDSKGMIRNPVIAYPAISDLNIEAMRILAESPPWEPGYQNNLPVNTACSWDFNFSENSSLAYKPKVEKPLYEEETFTGDRDVYFVVEDMPTFNNGDPAIEFRKFIAQNLTYPTEAAENSKQGRVILQFEINSEGNVCNPSIVVSVDPLLDAEALRVVMLSPKWKPGYQRGKPVSVLYTFPINFVLPNLNINKNF
ncbi:MAG: TonB family protein [Bacteroidales bacterium]|nr:TonB family protein [Bacteroidales bacterium]